MPVEPLIVLKFGGSVLLDDSRMRLAVHEIYRWRREGWRVVAVVSALAGRTNELLARCDRLFRRPSPHTVAAVIGTGELESATLLGLHLDRAGLLGETLAPGAIGLVAEGPALDAMPNAVEQDVIRSALERAGIVVIPGFVAVDRHGRTVTLGRGGSDLSALYLADELRADVCRLVKDVHGLYEWDPARPGPAPRRFASMTYEDALATDGSIVQHKAIRFAQARALRFELGRFNGTRPTRIGDARTTLDDRRVEPTPMSVVLLGAGAVGGGVLELLEQLPELFTVGGIAVRSPSSASLLAARGLPVTTDALALAGSNADVAVETIGGLDVAGACVRAALAAGSSVVTANKALLAAHGEELRALAVRCGRRLSYSASVGGSVPVLEHVAVDPIAIESIRGVLNGTCNYILERVTDGTNFHAAVAEAQRLGFAEADPTRDLAGTDALDKLLLIAHECGHGTVAAADDSDRCELIEENVTSRLTRRESGALKQVARLDRDGRCSVSIEWVEPNDPLFDVRDEYNGLVIERRQGPPTVLRGRGAGRWPTAEAVIADLLQLSRERGSEAAAPVASIGSVHAA